MTRFLSLSDETKKRIVIIINEVSEVVKNKVFQIFETMDQNRKKSTNTVPVLEVIEYEEANQLLLQSTPNIKEASVAMPVVKPGTTVILRNDPNVIAKILSVVSQQEAAHRNSMENEERDGSRSPSPPRILFSGPVVK